MENETQVTTLTPDSAAAAAAGSTTCMFLKRQSPGATTAAATPPANQLRASQPSRARQAGVSPEGCPPCRESQGEADSRSRRARRHSSLDYEFVLRGGREEVVRVKSQLVLPMALALENLPQTDVEFPGAFRSSHRPAAGREVPGVLCNACLMLHRGPTVEKEAAAAGATFSAPGQRECKTAQAHQRHAVHVCRKLMRNRHCPRDPGA